LDQLARIEISSLSYRQVQALLLEVVGRRMLRLPAQDILVASNAAVGGPATAAAMVSALRWPNLRALISGFSHELSYYMDLAKMMRNCIGLLDLDLPKQVRTLGR
jgi:NaMN:DMB phosphoribosyltransferase